jgi:hypothetical protein
MEDDAADHLHVVMALAEHALGRLAHRGEGLGQNLVERLARRQPLAEHPGLAARARRTAPRWTARTTRSSSRSDCIDFT